MESQSENPPKLCFTNNKSIEMPKKVFLFKEILLNGGDQLHLERLRHPGSGECGYFILYKKEKQIYEVLEFDQLYRSWLINSDISSNGKCYITIPIDIRFFALYFLNKNCKKQALPLNQWQEDKYPITISTISEFLSRNVIEEIADVKVAGDIIAYKYNEIKALAWIILKVELLAETLKQKRIHVGCHAVSATFVESDATKSASEDDYLEFSCGIIGTYIENDLYEKLLKHFSFKSKQENNKRKPFETLINEPAGKRAKVISTDKEKGFKEKKVTSKEKTLAKAAHGTNSIQSFFKKRT